MNTHNDSFCGPAGKVSNLALPKMYSTPRSNRWEFDYSVSLGSNIRGDFVACSLDGRLWLFRLSRRLAVVVCNWNNKTLQLVRSASSNINNNYDTILARGFNWVLSNNNIFMADESSPYVRRATLFDPSYSETSFCYSFLKSQVIYPHSSEYGLIGLYTNRRLASLKSACSEYLSQAFWGQRQDNGNSSGDAFFNTSTHLLYPPDTHSFEQCYSLLPTVGDWIIFENFLIRKPDKPLSQSYHGMLNIRPLIPLELHSAKLNAGTAWETITSIPAFGSGYNFDHRGIQVASLHNQLWARGIHHIGKVFIFAAGFDARSEPQEYYLYISPDFPNISSSLDSSALWLDVALAAIGDNENIYAFVSDVTDPISGGFCVPSVDGRILNLSGDNSSWIDLLHEENNELNPRIFFDLAHHSALLLHDKGARFFLSGLEQFTDFSCNTLRQWLAPAGIVEAVSDTGVISKADNSAFFTEIQRAFHRNVLTPCTLPLSGRAFPLDDEDERYVKLSVAPKTNSSTSALSLQVKHSHSENTTLSPIAWEDVYRQPVTLQYIGEITVDVLNDEYLKGFEFFAFHKDDCDPSAWADYVDALDPQVGLYSQKHRKDVDFSLFGNYMADGYGDFNPLPIFWTRLEYSDRDTDPKKYYYESSREQYFYYYHSIEADLVILNLQTLTAQLMTVSVHTNKDIISGPYGNLQPFYSNNVLGFRYYVLDTSADNPLHARDDDLVEDFWSQYAWSSVRVTGAIIKDFVAINIPDHLFNLCSDLEPAAGDNFRTLSQQKISSLVSPSVQLDYITHSSKYQDHSVAVFSTADTYVPFLLEFPVGNVTSTVNYTYPDRSSFFSKSNGKKYSKSQLHMSIVRNSSNEPYHIYSFRSTYDPSVFNFDVDFERCKSS